jgi:hypothetical protein
VRPAGPLPATTHPHPHPAPLQDVCRRHVLSTALIMAGNALIVAFGDHRSLKITLPGLAGMVRAPRFVAYVACVYPAVAARAWPTVPWPTVPSSFPCPSRPAMPQTPADAFLFLSFLSSSHPLILSFSHSLFPPHPLLPFPHLTHGAPHRPLPAMTGPSHRTLRSFPPPPSRAAAAARGCAGAARSALGRRRTTRGAVLGRPPSPPSRTKWTCLVPPSVLTGHVSSLLPY